MGDVAIHSRGGTKLFAAIGVTYPAGSAVTCTNGSRTFKAKTTTGQWVFAVPEAGTWTVTATDGTQSASQSLSISAEGQFESVELMYWDGTLYDAGNEYESITGGWSVAGTASKEAAYLDVYVAPRGYNGAAYTNNAIDLTDWSTLSFTIQGVNNFISLGVTKNAPDPNGAMPDFAVEVHGDEADSFDIDISNLTGLYYIWCGQYTTTSTEKYGADVTKVKLS